MGAPAGRDRDRGPRVQIRQCIGRRFLIDREDRSIRIFGSDGVSCDSSSASHQSGCESRRRAARGYILVVTIFHVGLFFSLFGFVFWSVEHSPTSGAEQRIVQWANAGATATELRDKNAARVMFDTGVRIGHVHP